MVSRLRLPPTLAVDLAKYRIHPALLDTCLHVIAATIPEEFIRPDSGETYLPIGVKRVRGHRRPEGELWIHARMTTDPAVSGEDLLEGEMQLRDAAGNVFLEMEGLSLRRLAANAKPGTETAPNWLYEVQWRPAEPPSNGAVHVEQGIWALVAAGDPVAEALAERWQQQGRRCEIVSPAQAACGLAQENTRGVVFFGALDAAPIDLCEAAVQLLQRLTRIPGAAPHFCIVTRGAHAIDPDNIVHAAHAALWGLGRVLTVEHPELHPLLVDLEPDAAASRNALALDDLIRHPGGVGELAVRDSRRFVPRLAPCPPQWLDTGRAIAARRLSVPRDGAFRVDLTSTGSIDRLTIRPLHRRAPAKGEVEIAVRAAGLNFSDVLKALGLYPGLAGPVVPLGIECAGVLTAVGEGVDGLAVGDEVVAIAPFSFASHTTTSAVAVVKKPAHLTFEEAATIPITFLTAHYGLHYLARMQAGERVLIHAAAGGVGQAAIQICQRTGAEVFATAGSPEKRSIVTDAGVAHVHDSRTLAFADEIRQATDGAGVDIVLNSLPGEAIPRSLGLLRAYGRFLEIGKTDIYQNRMLGLLPFQNNLSYFAIDLDRMLRERPALVREMFVELMQQFEAREYRPLPLTAFPVSDVAGAFRYMANRKNVGKVVVTLAAETAGSGDPRRARSAEAAGSGDPRRRGVRRRRGQETRAERGVRRRRGQETRAERGVRRRRGQETRAERGVRRRRGQETRAERGAASSAPMPHT